MYPALHMHCSYGQKDQDPFSVMVLPAAVHICSQVNDWVSYIHLLTCTQSITPSHLHTLIPTHHHTSLTSITPSHLHILAPTTPAVPPRPTRPVITRVGSNWAVISWSEPTCTGGHTIVSYTIRHYKQSSSFFSREYRYTNSHVTNMHQRSTSQTTRVMFTTPSP